MKQEYFKKKSKQCCCYFLYKGYYPKIQNTDLLIIQGALKAIQQNNTKFEDNVKLKYEK